MPRVAYHKPQQGFRPNTNPGAALAGLQKRVSGRALGDGLPGSSFIGPISTWLSTPSAPPVPGPVSAGDVAWNWLATAGGITEGCYPWDITCSEQPLLVKNGQAQIQSVVDNAAYYYGPESTVAQVAAQAAAQQEAQVPGDVSALAASTPSVGPMGIPWWMWAVGIFFVAKEL